MVTTTDGRWKKVTITVGVFNYTFLANSDLITSMTRPNNVLTDYTNTKYIIQATILK